MAVSLVGTGGQGLAASGVSFTILISTATVQAGDLAVVCYSVPRALTHIVTSSSGAEFTLLNATTTGNLNTGLLYRFLGAAGETTVTCTGTGNSQDGQTGVAYVLRGTSSALPITWNSTIGSGTTPNSPGVTVYSTLDVVLSLVGSLIADTAVTAPTSFLNARSTASSDTRSTTTAGATITSVTKGSYDPTGWSAFTSAAWVAFTVNVMSTQPYTPFRMVPNEGDTINEYSKYGIVGY